MIQMVLSNAYGDISCQDSPLSPVYPCIANGKCGFHEWKVEVVLKKWSYNMGIGYIKGIFSVKKRYMFNLCMWWCLLIFQNISWVKSKIIMQYQSWMAQRFQIVHVDNLLGENNLKNNI